MTVLLEPRKLKNNERKIEWRVDKNTGCFEIISHHRCHWHPIIVRDNKRMTINRYVWILKKGKIPKGMIVRHKCDNPRCININHLVLGTPKDNSRDMCCRNRQANGEKNGSVKLKRNQVLEIYLTKEKQRVLAKKYKVDRSQIGYIKRGVSWKWLTKKVGRD